MIRFHLRNRFSPRKTKLEFFGRAIYFALIEQLHESARGVAFVGRYTVTVERPDKVASVDYRYLLQLK